MILAGLVALIVIAVAGVATLRAFPSLGALGADRLRAVVGDRAVAQAEGLLFRVQDSLAELEYRLGWMKVSSPWQAASGLPIRSGTVQKQGKVSAPRSLPTPEATQTRPGLPPPQATPAQTGHPSPAPVSPPAQASPTPSAAWSLPPVPALGRVPGEGIWTPYLQDASGQTVAMRTFLQPDPSRPYALTGIVAFDLRRVDLHFVIGTQEPYAQAHPSIRADGKIPAVDLAPGVLLAAFNGGFKYPQGHFGAMAAGLVSAPPLDGLATVAIDTDGRVQIGAWGQDLDPKGAYRAYRQNGPLAIRAGQVSSLVSDPKYWGFTVRGTTATWRSGLGISRDGNILYYAAGPYLTIDSLTRAMLRAGVWNAMQLDINDYWVHFDAYQPAGIGLAPDPLFPEWKNVSDDRFLRVYSRDFFYATLR